MVKFLFKFLLFLSSYFPLFLIFTVQTFSIYGSWSFIFVIIGLISLLALPILVNHASRTGRVYVDVLEVSDKDQELFSYIVTYIFPFLDLDFSRIEDIISLFILFLLLSFIYVNSNLIYINPMLTIFGYHIYQVSEETKSGQQVNFILISKELKRKINKRISVVKLTDEILWQ